MNPLLDVFSELNSSLHSTHAMSQTDCWLTLVSRFQRSPVREVCVIMCLRVSLKMSGILPWSSENTGTFYGTFNIRLISNTIRPSWCDKLGQNNHVTIAVENYYHQQYIYYEAQEIRHAVNILCALLNVVDSISFSGLHSQNKASRRWRIIVHMETASSHLGEQHQQWL